MSSAVLPTLPLRRFVLISIALYLVWFFVYDLWLAPDGRLDAWLCDYVARGATWLLRGVGFEASVADRYKVLMHGQPAVLVGAPCNGLVLYALFTGFIVAFAGPWRLKLLYIPVGIALIYLLNLIRVAALALNFEYARASVDFNHHYTFSFVVYWFIFMLWMWWARRYSPKAAAQTSAA